MNNPTKATILAFLAELSASERYDEEEGVSTFPSGRECCRCTSGAIEVVNHFGGTVMGFQHGDNPTATIASYCFGHDFAIVEDRWLVDYWAHYVDNPLLLPVLDLRDPDDAEQLSLYGDRRCWSYTCGPDNAATQQLDNVTIPMAATAASN